MNERYGNSLKWFLKLSLTLIAMTIALRQVEWHDLQTAFITQDKLYLLLAVIITVLQITAGSGRWYCLLQIFLPKQFSFLRSLRVYYASLLFNTCLPGTTGSDVMRVVMLRNKEGRNADAIASVVFDRLFSFKSLAIILLLFLPHLFGLLGFSTTLGIWISLICMTLGAIMLLLLYRAAPAMTNISHLSKLRTILVPLAKLFHHPLLLLSSLLCGTLAHASYCLCAYLLLKSLGQSVSLVDCMTLIPFVMLASSLPISISGWGMRELSITAALGIVGVSSAAAVLAGLQLGVLATLLSLLGGVFYLTHKRQNT